MGGHLHMQMCPGACTRMPSSSVIKEVLETRSGQKQVLDKDTSHPKYTTRLAGGHMCVSGPHSL